MRPSWPMLFRSPRKMERLEFLLITGMSTKQAKKLIFCCQIFTFWLITVLSMKCSRLWIVTRAITRSLWMKQIHNIQLLLLLGVYIIIGWYLWGLKNIGATYMRDMPTIFHNMIHKRDRGIHRWCHIQVSRELGPLDSFEELFDRLRHYNLKLNPAKCAFGMPTGKLVGFKVSKRGIELEPSKINIIQELPLTKTKKEVMSFLGNVELY